MGAERCSARNRMIMGNARSERMQVALFADSMYYRIAAGSTRYAGELARHIAALEDVDLRLFSLYTQDVIDTAARDRGYPSAQSCTGFVPRPLQYMLWHTAGWSGSAASVLADADVVHAPAFLIPPRGRRPLVVTVLDLAFLLFPQYFSRRLRLTAGRGLRRAVRDADAFITISEHTGQDLMRLLDVASDRIHVIPLAADRRFVPVENPEVPAKYGVDTPYVLYVGTLEPRKNLILLLRAFATVKGTEVKLVLAGTKGWLYEDIFATVQSLGLGSRVIFTGFVPDEDLPALISAAQAFVYPSVYEGFGLPVLEAMKCGTPVITTNISSLPEVAGNAAITVSPDDVEGLSRAIQRLLAEPGLRTELREKGFEQAARFSWAKTAEQTVEVYREVLR